MLVQRELPRNNVGFGQNQNSNLYNINRLNNPACPRNVFEYD